MEELITADENVFEVEFEVIHNRATVEYYPTRVEAIAHANSLGSRAQVFRMSGSMWAEPKLIYEVIG